MAVSRRHFLALGRLLAVAAAVPAKLFGVKLVSSFPGAGKKNSSSVTNFSKQTFLPLVNSSFSVQSGSTTIAWLTLLSVEDLTPKPLTGPPMAVPPKTPQTPPPKLDTFALHFQGTGETLPQDTYELEHRALGQFPLFIVPSEPSAGNETYTAIFNHLLTSQPLTHPPIRRVGTGRPPIQQGGEPPVKLNERPGAAEPPTQMEPGPSSAANRIVPR